jgi:hypothetical protein
MSMVVVHVASGTRDILVFLGRMAEAMGHALQLQAPPTRLFAVERNSKCISRSNSSQSCAGGTVGEPRFRPKTIRVFIKAIMIAVHDRRVAAYDSTPRQPPPGNGGATRGNDTLK